MNRMRLLTVVAGVLCCSCNHVEEASVSQASNGNDSELTDEVITIPLEQTWSSFGKRTWAIDEPVTQLIYELEKDVPSDQSRLTEIRRVHSSGTWEDGAGPAFAVEGTDLEALKNAHAVITGQKPRADSLSQENKISIVFFTLSSNYYVALTKIERKQNAIHVLYEFIPKDEENLPQEFAMIPMGKLPPGRYQVEFVREPFEKRFRDAGWEKIPDERNLRRVSSSFEFIVS